MRADTSTTTNTSSSRSRRALLAGALGGVGAWAAAVIGRASQARAADGDPVLVGQGHTGTSQTSIANTGFLGTGFHGTGSFVGVSGSSTSGYGVTGLSVSAIAVFGNSTGSGTGVRGTSTSGIGVWGDSPAANQPAILGHSNGNSSGVMGLSGGGYSGPMAKTGVFGRATQDNGSRGVWGVSTQGRGVYGQATSGSALYGSASGKKGFALQGSGRVKLAKVSGVATINAGSTSKVVTPGVDVTSGSFVLLTPKANIGSRGLWFTTNATANTFTIRMSSVRGSATKVAWLLLG